MKGLVQDIEGLATRADAQADSEHFDGRPFE
jgi:hypothetical protein